MLTQISLWWWRQILSLVPARLRRAGPADAVIIEIDHMDEDFYGVDGAVLVRRDGVERAAGPLRLPGRSVANPAPGLATAVRLPEGMVLRREVSLPLAAERDLTSVLGFEMDRFTPFEPGEIFWSVAGVRRDAARGLAVTLLITLRAPLERLLESLAACGLKPGFVESPAGRIALSAPGATREGRLRWGLLGLSAVLALACVVIPPVRQNMALGAAQAQIAALLPAAREALTVRRQLEIAASGQSAVSAARNGGDALRTMAALTAALPDGTSITDFSLKSGELTMDGASTDAARLIAVLAAVPGFQNPRFVAPVTRATSGQTDLFSIQLTVTP